MGNKPKKISQKKVVQLVSQLSGLSQKQCAVVLDDYMTVLTNCCLNGMEVPLPGIGFLSVKYKPYRAPEMKPNVTKGGAMCLTKGTPEHNIPHFRFALPFKEDMRYITMGNPVFKPDKYKIAEEECDNDIQEDMEIGGEVDGIE